MGITADRHVVRTSSLVEEEVLSPKHMEDYFFFERDLRVIFSECRESEDSHEKSIFLLFGQNIPLGELIQEKIV